MALHPFHLAFPVRDIASTRAFYEGVVGAGVGRQAERWIDFDLYGHQLSAHVSEDLADPRTSDVDGHAVPVRHFGVVLPWGLWEQLAERLRSCGVAFLIAPTVRFRGQVGEQATLFVRDPSGNALEFKAFRDPQELFAR